MSDADAFEIAQPLPMKLTSAMRSWSSLTHSLSESPHNGLRPSTVRSASGISRKLRGFRLCSRISSWYSASVDTGDAPASDEPLECGALESLADRIDLDRLEHVGGERVGEQPTRQRVGDASRLQIEERGLVDLSHGRAVRALHVVGEDLELRLRVDVRGVGEQQRVVRLLAVRLLRDRPDVDLSVEYAVRPPVENALVQLSAERVRLSVDDLRLVVAMLLAVEHIETVQCR